MEDRNLYGRAVGVEERGRHTTTASAIEAALKDLITVKSEFFDEVHDNWARLFPQLPARPGRYEDGIVFLYVKNASLSFAVRPKLKAIGQALQTLKGAPKKVEVKVEVHSI